MVKNILIINVGIFILQVLFTLPFEDLFGLRVVFSDEFRPFQFLTYMWIHANFYHLLSNMFAVFIFGPLLEQVWGSKRFLTFYLICGIGAAVLYGGVDFVEKYPMKVEYDDFMFDPSPEKFESYIAEYKVDRRFWGMLSEFKDQYFDNPQSNNNIAQARAYVSQIFGLYADIGMVGASGAVFGILMAFGMLFPNTQLYLLFPPIPVKAKYLVLFYGLYEVYAEFGRVQSDNIAHLAHLGGMAIAFVLIKIWQKNNNRFY